MTKYTVDTRAIPYRDEDNVLHFYRRGEEIELTPEQEQRLRAGEPGSGFRRAGEESRSSESETTEVEVATANEADSPKRRVEGEKAADAETGDEPSRPATDSGKAEADEGDLPKPTSSTRGNRK